MNKCYIYIYALLEKPENMFIKYTYIKHYALYMITISYTKTFIINK